MEALDVENSRLYKFDKSEHVRELQKKSSPKKYNSKQNKKVDVSVSESSFNDKRMASAKFSQSKIKEDPIQSTQKKAGFLSPKERMKARNAQLERDY